MRSSLKNPTVLIFHRGSWCLYCNLHLSVDLESASGQTHHILPVPAVFIVDRGGNIVFVHADPDYKVRMKGAEVLAAAKAAATTSDALQK